jgi:undecaprenyl pyrophosphate synthase
MRTHSYVPDADLLIQTGGSEGRLSGEPPSLPPRGTESIFSTVNYKAVVFPQVSHNEFHNEVA